METAYNYTIKLRFHSVVNVPSDTWSTQLNAFTVTFKRQMFIHSTAQVSASIHPTSIAYGKNADGTDNKEYLILTLSTLEDFRNCIGDITVSYNASVGTMYGKRMIDVAANVSAAFTPTNIEIKRDPDMAAETIKLKVTGTKLYYTKITTLNGYFKEAVKLKVTTNATKMTYVIVGQIKP